MQKIPLLLPILLALCLLTRSVDAADRPNVLFLLSDDQRLDTISALGNEHIRTPALDSLVKGGTTFTNGYCLGSNSGAVCAPSRAMIMTGRAYFRFGGNIFNMKSDEPLLPELFRKQGYQTFGTGKWHNGREWFRRSFTDGDAIFFGGMGSHTTLPVNRFDEDGEFPQSKRYRLPEFSSTTFANAAIDFLKKRDMEKPFFAYVAFTAPHDPRTPPEEHLKPYLENKPPLPENFLPLYPYNSVEHLIRDEKLAKYPRTEAEVRRQLAEYYGMITQMDEQISRVLEALKETGEYDNTIIVFASDHGLGVGSHGLLGKQNLYEHSMKAPIIVAGPGLPADKRMEALAYLHDIFPTLLDLAGIEKPGDIDGESLVPAVKGEADSVRDTLFTAYKGLQRSVRDSRWKLLVHPTINEVELFDLRSDPHELKDLSGHPDYWQHTNRLLDELRGWQRRLGDDQPLFTNNPKPAFHDYGPHLSPLAGE